MVPPSVVINTVEFWPVQARAAQQSLWLNLTKNMTGLHFYPSLKHDVPRQTRTATSKGKQCHARSLRMQPSGQDR